MASSIEDGTLPIIQALENNKDDELKHRATKSTRGRLTHADGPALANLRSKYTLSCC